MDRNTWIGFLKFLSHNRILFHFIARIFPKYFHQLGSSVHADLIALTKTAKEEEGKTQRTIGYFKADLPQALLVKTYKFIPYVTFDLDLLVDDVASVDIELQKSQHPGKQNKHQKNYKREDMLRLDLHDNFYWQGFKYLDLELVKKSTQQVNYFGYTVTIPSYTVDFLLNCAHILFERRYITFLDFWYLKKLLDDDCVDWDSVWEQSSKYGWESSLKMLLGVMKKLEEQVTLPRGAACFPHMLGWPQIFRIYKEKFLRDNKLPVFDIVYYIFARARGALGIEPKYPYYIHWFDFSSL